MTPTFNGLNPRKALTLQLLFLVSAKDSTTCLFAAQYLTVFPGEMAIRKDPDEACLEGSRPLAGLDEPHLSSALSQTGKMLIVNVLFFPLQDYSVEQQGKSIKGAQGEHGVSRGSPGFDQTP